MHPVTVRLKNLTQASLKECHEYVCTMRLDETHGLMLEIGVAASVLRHPIELIGNAANSVHLEVLDSWLVSPGGHCSHRSITDEKKYQELSDKHSHMICILYQQYLFQALRETHDLILSAVCSHTPHAATQTHHPASPTVTLTAFTSGIDSRQHQIKRGGALSDPPMPQQVDLCEDVTTGQVSETMENILDVHTAQADDADNSNSLVFLTSIDNNCTTHQSALTDKWGNQISKDFVDTKLDWIGDRDILGRTHGSMIVMTVNSKRRTHPRPNQDKIEDKCRLPHLTSLVTSALVDIVVVPEAAAKLNEKLAHHATRLVQHSSGGRIRAHSAPTSTAVNTMENILAGSLVTRVDEIWGVRQISIDNTLPKCTNSSHSFPVEQQDISQPRSRLRCQFSSVDSSQTENQRERPSHSAQLQNLHRGVHHSGRRSQHCES